MGTRGYRVYRYKGYYLIIYNHSDSYPECLGVSMLGSVPKDPKKYERWLEKNRASLSQRFEEQKEDSWDDKETISRIEPSNDVFIEWMYELDFDHEVFLVDGEPLFDMRSMPPTDIFLDAIGEDSFGHRACAPSIPKQYRYNWKVGPPAVDPLVTERYSELVKDGGCLRVDDNLMLQGFETSVSQVRIHLYDVFIRVLLQDRVLAHYLRRVDLIENRDDIPLDLAGAAISMLQLALDPMIFEQTMKSDSSTPAYRHRVVEDENEIGSFVWLAQDLLCIRLATHLDDEANLQAAVVDLLEHMRNKVVGKKLDEGDKENGTVIYGILFSFFHCVVLRMDLKDSSFARSPVLQFLPSFYWTPSDSITPGIIAVANVGYSLLPLLIAEDEQLVPPGYPFAHQDSIVSKVPEELWCTIASHLFATRDLAALSTLSSSARNAVVNVLSLPLVGGARLLNLLPMEEKSRARGYYTAIFDAVYDEETEVKRAKARQKAARARRSKSTDQSARSSISGDREPSALKKHGRVGVFHISRPRGLEYILQKSSKALQEGTKKVGFREHMAHSLQNICFDIDYEEKVREQS